MGQNISAIVFDVGGVLLEIHPAARHAYYESLAGARLAELKEAMVGSARIEQRWVRGHTDFAGVSAFVHEFLNLSSDHTHTLRQAELAILGNPIAETVDLLHRVRQNLPIAILSNTVDLHWEEVQQRLPFLATLPHCYASHQIEKAKPDPEAFLHVSEALGVPLLECLMVDDVEANITAAQQLGMQTHLFVNPRELQSFLGKRSIQN